MLDRFTSLRSYRARNTAAFIVVVVIALLARGFLMESMDLIDPTEARYAVVAQEMVTSGDWITPKLPLPQGNVPYLGKPPLHFWLTALSYKLFGVDEWSSRLVSLVGTAVLVSFIFLFVQRISSVEQAIISVLIFLTSALTYSVAGASVTDVTLTAMVTSSVIFLYSFVALGTGRGSWFLGIISGALAFLVKGPVGLVLIGLPFALWSLARRNLSWVRVFPWMSSIGLFLLITAPWFILSELQNPGFIKYFFWNENIARYLFKDYGDLYGSGHRYPYGVCWLMLFGAFFPWSLSSLALLDRENLRRAKASISQSEHLLFVLSWALAAPLFFTFVRQLHALYILPAIPPLSVLCSIFFSSSRVRGAKVAKALEIFSRAKVLGTFTLSLFLFSLYWEASFITTSLVVVFVIVGTLGIGLVSRAFPCPVGFTLRICTGVLTAYLVILLTFSSYVNVSRSAEAVLRRVVANDNCDSAGGSYQIGVSTSNTFSHYWATRNWSVELGKPAQITYVNPEGTAPEHLCFYLTKTRELKDLPKSVEKSFSIVFTEGDWVVFRRTEQSQSAQKEKISGHG